MKKSADVIYLTRKKWDAFKEEEHRDRVALSQRVARGELTPEQANREASLFQPEVFNPAEARTANFDEVVDNLLKLKARRTNDRRKPKAIRA